VTTIEEDVGRDPDPDRPGAVRLILRMSVDNATGYAA